MKSGLLIFSFYSLFLWFFLPAFESGMAEKRIPNNPWFSRIYDRGQDPQSIHFLDEFSGNSDVNGRVAILFSIFYNTPYIFFSGCYLCLAFLSVIM